MKMKMRMDQWKTATICLIISASVIHASIAAEASATSYAECHADCTNNKWCKYATYGSATGCKIVENTFGK